VGGGDGRAKGEGGRLRLVFVYFGDVSERAIKKKRGEHTIQENKKNSDGAGAGAGAGADPRIPQTGRKQNNLQTGGDGEYLLTYYLLKLTYTHTRTHAHTYTHTQTDTHRDRHTPHHHQSRKSAAQQSPAMPPLPRLLPLLLTTTLFSLFLALLYTLPTSGFGFGGDHGGRLSTRTPSLFPKSAIITLTDDVSTFFLARPAAFGPELPEEEEDTGGGNGDGGEGGGGGGGSGRGRAKGLTGRLVAVPEGVDGCGEGEAPPGGDDEEEEETISSGGEELKRKVDEGRDRYIYGRIVLIPRGGCGFLEKVMWAQRRGALAVIVGDNVSGRGLVTMYARGELLPHLVYPRIEC